MSVLEKAAMYIVLTTLHSISTDTCFFIQSVVPFISATVP